MAPCTASGGMDVGLLLMLQAAAPEASITAEAVEGSTALTLDFKGVDCFFFIFTLSTIVCNT